MSTSIAALPPAHHRIPHEPEYDGAPDVPEIAFSELWQSKEEGMTFGDFIDIINPLQHIPIISTIYRMATEDDIGVGSRVLGGALFGGPLGLVGAGLTAIFEDVSGDTVEQHVASLWNAVTGDDEATPSVTQTASNAPAAQQPAVVKEPQPAAASLMIEDDYAAAAPQPGPTASRAIPAGEPIPAVPAAPVVQLAAAQPAPPIQASPQPLPRPPVSVSPLTAIHRVNNAQPEPAVAHRVAENQRIAKAIDQAQRAQAGLLLASVGADRSTQQQEAGESDAPEQRQPFKAHPYLLPRGAPPQLVSRAMEQALAKYQATLQQRNLATTAASPRPAPAPIK